MLGLCCALAGEEAHLICPHMLYPALSLCLHVTAFNQPMSVLFQARCFPAPLQAAQWQSGVPNPPAVRGPH